MVTDRINTDNDAFGDDPIFEVQKILAVVPAKLSRIISRKTGCVCTAPEADDKLKDDNGNTVGSIQVRSTERRKPSERLMQTRPQLNLVVAPKACQQMMAKPDPRADGWCNQATHTFSIYMLQEKNAYEGLCSLIRRRDGRRTDNLYRCAQAFMQGFYTSGKTEPMDDDLKDDPINVREIVDQLADELKIVPTEPYTPTRKV